MSRPNKNGQMQRPKGGLVVGICHRTSDSAGPAGEASEDERAGPQEERSPGETIDGLANAIAQLGHQPVLVQVDERFAHRVTRLRIDLAFNLLNDRGRPLDRSEVTSVLEENGVAVVGAGPASLKLCKDKWLAKKRVLSSGLATPPSQLLEARTALFTPALRAPLVVKLCSRGSLRGICENDVVATLAAAERKALALIRETGLPVLVEEYVFGRELCVAVLETDGCPTTLPPVEICFDQEIRYPVYARRHKLQAHPAVDRKVARLPRKLDRQLRSAAIKVHRVLGCRDLSEVYFRLDHWGEPQFLVCNTSPRLFPESSEFRIAAKATGRGLSDLVEVLINAARCPERSLHWKVASTLPLPLPAFSSTSPFDVG